MFVTKRRALPFTILLLLALLLAPLRALAVGPGWWVSNPAAGKTDRAWYNGWVVSALQAQLIGPDARYRAFEKLFLEPDRPATRAEAAMLLGNLPAFR